MPCLSLRFHFESKAYNFLQQILHREIENIMIQEIEQKESPQTNKCSVKPWIIIIAAIFGTAGAIFVGMMLGGYFDK